MKEITVEELQSYSLEDYLLIDIRSRIAYDNGHILDAISFPEPFEISKLEKIIRDSGKKKAILYCTIGEHSKEYVDQLSSSGVDVYNLKDGYKAWLIYCEKELGEEEKEQYSRQIILPELGINGQKKLRSARVLVIGAGALGTVALTYLAAAGVGCIGIAEGDSIDASNLHRQILYTRSDVGKSKLQVASERIQQMNPFIRVRKHEYFLNPKNISAVVRDYDFVIDASDRIETKFLINDACVLENVPFCHAGVVGFQGQVMTWVPGDYPCYRCIFEDVPDDYIPNCAEAGIIGAMSGVIGSVQALEAVKYIAGIGDLLLGKIFFFDGKTLNIRTIDLPKKSEDCMVCGKKTIEDVSKHEEKYRIKGCAL